MTRENGWAGKVLTLLKGSNIDAALAQIKVAPSVRDLKHLRAAIAAAGLGGRWPTVDETITDQIDALAAPRLHRSP